MEVYLRFGNLGKHSTKEMKDSNYSPLHCYHHLDRYLYLDHCQCFDHNLYLDHCLCCNLNPEGEEHVMKW